MCSEKFTKMAGYLEKRGKLSIMGRWKKWWCVLEGQLLLYYKSRIDYSKLSPCCGSLNMALVKNVQPHIGCQIHIVTHTQLIILRTKNKEKQQQWFHVLIGVLPQNRYLSPLFYFSTHPADCKIRKSDRKKKKSKNKYFLQKQFTELDTSDHTELYKNTMHPLTNESLNFTSTSSFEARTLTEIQNTSTPIPQQMQIRAEDIIQYSIRTNKLIHSSVKYSSEINIRRYSSYHSMNNISLKSEASVNRRSISCECVFNDHRITSVEMYEFLRSSIRSDQGTKDENQHPEEVAEIQSYEQSSVYRHLRKASKKNGTLSKRSFSFLKKIFKKRTENLDEQPAIICTKSNEEIDENPVPGPIIEIQNLESPVLDFQERSSIQTNNDESAQNKIEEITIYNHFVEKKTTNTSSNIETQSEPSETETENNVVDSSQVEEKLPDLPIKNGNRLSSVSHDFENTHLDFHEKEHRNGEVTIIGTCANMELDSLLQQLTALNNECDKSHHSLEFTNNTMEDPDYDIPRPHKSLISETENNISSPEKNYTEYFNNSASNQQYKDSLSMDMAPDSLEMPWLLNDNKCNINYWTTKKEFNLSLENDSGSEYDYHDSLNSNNKFYT